MHTFLTYSLHLKTQIRENVSSFPFSSLVLPPSGCKETNNNLTKIHVRSWLHISSIETVTTRILFFLNINITNIILVLKVPILPMILNNKVCKQWKWRKKNINFYYHNFISLTYSWSCQLARQTKTCMLSRPLVLPLRNQNETWQQMSKYSKYSVGK